jgi:3-oxoadipate enol-lactonase
MRNGTKTLLALGAGALAARALVRREARLAEEARAAGQPIRRTSRLAQRLDPYRFVPVGSPLPPPLPAGRLVPVPGRGEMFVRQNDRTEGVPVLLLHGWMASADLNFFGIMTALGEHHPVLAVDHRGHGRGIRDPHLFTLEDCADDAAALLRHLGIGSVVAVGYSMGGPVATLLWRRHPDLVSGLVLEATGLEWHETPRERATWRLMWLFKVLLRSDIGRFILTKTTGGDLSVPTELVPYRAWLEGEFRRGDPVDMAEAGRALGRYDARPFAREIDVPVAVVVTTKDQLVLPEKQLQLAAATGATVFELEGDHLAPVLVPQELAAVTLRAIAAVSGAVEAEETGDSIGGTEVVEAVAD